MLLKLNPQEDPVEDAAAAAATTAASSSTAIIDIPAEVHIDPHNPHPPKENLNWLLAFLVSVLESSSPTLNIFGMRVVSSLGFYLGPCRWQMLMMRSLLWGCSRHLVGSTLSEGLSPYKRVACSTVVESPASIWWYHHIM